MQRLVLVWVEDTKKTGKKAVLSCHHYVKRKGQDMNAENNCGAGEGFNQGCYFTSTREEEPVTGRIETSGCTEETGSGHRSGKPSIQGRAGRKTCM